MIEYNIIFWSAYFQVFLLGLNAKLLRDDKIASGFVVSWMITVAQYAFIKAVAHGGLSDLEFVLVAGAGGSIGITTAQYFYRWYDRRFH